MTIQNKMSLGQIGPIRVGGGFHPKTPAPSYIYPNDRLSNFLNFDSKNIDEICKFCSDYQIIFPSPDPIVIGRFFHSEQKSLRKIANKLSGGTIDKNDLNVINEKLGEIKFRLSYIQQENKTNEQNTPLEIRAKLSIDHLLFGKYYPNSIVSLWEDLVKHFVELQDTKTCANCGDFFVIKSRHPRRFCEKEQCKNTYNKTKSRLLKRKLKQK